MLDQLTIAQKNIGFKYSYDDFEASVKSHKIIDGAKKTIKETVPFSNVTYDFSKINGELYWEEKTLEYVLEITAPSIEELGVKVTAFKSWIMNVVEARLEDPYIEDYYFLATFSNISVDDSEMEKATITVTFTAYPYMISKHGSFYQCRLFAGETETLTLVNNSSHPIVPTFDSDIAVVVTIGEKTYGIPSGHVTDATLKLEPGEIQISLLSSVSGHVAITFEEEVF